MKRSLTITLALVVVLAATGVWADDLKGANQLLCTAVQATECLQGGDCFVDLPWNLKVPQFIEVNLDTKRLSTTKASGENRETPITHLTREGDLIVLQGLENGRAFSFMITEETGRLAVAVATKEKTVAVFGACTPLPAAGAPAGK